MSRTLLALSLLLPAAAQAGFEASSFQKDSRRGDNYWNAGAALDGRPETAWSVDPEKKNEGQWIQLDTPSGELDKLAMVIGWDQDENSFFDYARVKRARVEAWSTSISGEAEQVLEQEVSFEDKRGWQIVELNDTKMGGEMGGGRVRITVLEVYPGKDYPSLRVSDLRVHLKEFPAETMMIKDMPANAVDGRGGELMEDTKESTFFATNDTSTRFTVTASGYQMSSVGFKSDAKGWARPRTVVIRSQGLEAEHTLEDKADWQFLLCPVVAGYTGSAWGTIEVEVKDTYEGKGLAINEIKLMAATIEDI